MFAKTKRNDWITRLTLLFSSAVALVHESKRSPSQTEKLLLCLQEFKDTPDESTVMTQDDYAVLRVTRTHGGEWANFIMVVRIGDIFPSPLGNERHEFVHFPAPTTGLGGVGGRVLFLLKKEQSAVVRAHLSEVPKED
ncbi:MAG: hypothetical protein JWN89_45 [Parcubacteria group bacterium]|nr:hypothetical protein [Parcubacteria group bacterium]